MQVILNRCLGLALLAVARATLPCAAEAQIVFTFEGKQGPGWKAAANVMGAVGPRHVVDFTTGGFTVHDRGQHVIRGNRVDGYRKELSIEPALHPGTTLPDSE